MLANAGLGLIAEMPTDDEESSDLVEIKDELNKLNQPVQILMHLKAA